METPTSSSPKPPLEAELPLALLCSFLFFLARRPISGSNSHYLASRLRGLKSLIPVLEQLDISPTLRRVLARIESATPESFKHHSRAIQMDLIAHRNRDLDLPDDFLISSDMPLGFARNVHTAMLLLGPSIGIGDEITLFPLPRYLKLAGVPRVEVFTMYGQLWDRVTDADAVQTYADHRELLELLRSRPEDPGHLRVLADFEKPGLAPVIAHEPNISRYLEISLGAQTALFVDQTTRRFHCFRMPSDHLVNYYRGLDKMINWLGVQTDHRTRFDKIVGNERRVSKDELVLFVSPFTSKFDPSSIYWSRLVRRLLHEGPNDRPTRVRIDAGANPRTYSFAKVLAHAIAIVVPRSVTVEVATEPGSSRLPLKQLWSELESADLVLCTDSFLAHGAPLFGCCVLILAGAELANWRVPHMQSFYFDATQPADRLADAMRSVLFAVAHPGSSNGQPARAFLHAGASLLSATTALSEARREGDDINGQAYDHFVAQYELTVEGLASWPHALQPLVDDVDYRGAWRVPSRSAGSDLTAYLESRLPQWMNTNLFKYLRLKCRQ